ncbi:MAG: extracellular solute-binding protein [Deltaproteobacteria bacterium]|nr:extracellular solute-binding protein [Deltaproteobacteria bacterium]
MNMRIGFIVAILVYLVCPTLMFSQTGPDPALIEAAKKEGELVYFTTMTLSQSKKVVDKFEKKYPFVKVDLFRTGGGPLLNKIQTEARGGRYAWDVVSGRGEMVLPLMNAKFLAPYRSPESKTIEEDLVDNEGYWTAYYVNPYVLGFNTNLVKKEDVPQTYEQLLDPKWKGKKISIDDEAYGLLSGLIKAWGREKAVSYFKKLAAQDPVPMRGNTNRVQLTVAGEYSLIVAYAPTIQRETSRGAPIDWVPLEPVAVQVNPMMLAAKAPHPNAAKLFIDFLLSKEGQKMLVGFRRIPVRPDVNPDPPRLFKGYKRIVEHPEEYKNFTETVKLYQEIFNLR